MESTSLQLFNDSLKNSDLAFLPVPEKEQGFYQLYSTMDSPFVYLCSNIPIERLNSGDLLLLQSAIVSGQAEVTPELTEMVKRTFSDVMMAYPDKDDDLYCGYGYGGEVSPNRSIVLEIRNYDFDDYGNFRDFANNGKRIDYMCQLVSEMEKTLSEQISHRIIVMFAP